MDSINIKDLHKRRTRLEKALLEGQNNVQNQQQILNLFIADVRMLENQLKATNRVILFMSHTAPDQPDTKADDTTA